MFWKKKEKKKDNKKSEKISALTTAQSISIFLTLVVVIGLWYLNYYVLNDSILNGATNDRGTFGDMFGAVNALFSGLAFAGIIWTILLQRNELRLQREDSKLSRDEAVDQNKTLRLQRFENTFFNMLNLQNEIVKNLKSSQLEGRQVIEEAQKRLYAYLNWENYQKAHKTSATPPESETTFSVPETYINARALLDTTYKEKFYNNFSTNFNHYFRHLYHIFKFIYFSGLRDSEKKFYATIARAQLSQGELYLIAFNNLIQGYGNPNFLYLTKEYDIIQNMDWIYITPKAFEQLIKVELENVVYPFDLPKPEKTND